MCNNDEPEIWVLNYFKDNTDNLKVRISLDLKSIILVNKDENFLMYKSNGNIVQKNLSSMNGFTVHYIEQDLVHESCFYIMQSRDYDSKLDIIHSHNRNY